MLNLLKETLDILTENGKTEDDITCVSICEFYTTWEQFKRIAKRINYNPYSTIWQISPYLYIIGSDWALERNSCRGTEFWTFEEYESASIRGNIMHVFTKDFFINPESGIYLSDIDEDEHSNEWNDRFSSRPRRY